MEDYFLRVDGIPGESLDDKHRDEIELVSFSWGLAQAAGGAAGRARFHDFQFTTHVSKASPQLFLSCASGKHLKEANLSVRRADKSRLEYLRIRFRDVLVTSFEEGAEGGDLPEEAVGLAFERIEFEYRPQQASGALGAPIKAGWNLSKHVKL